MSAYRSSAQHLRPTSLSELFEAGCDLESDGGLSVDYQLTPWKRHVVSVRYRPPSLKRYLADLSQSLELYIDLRHGKLPAGRYRVVSKVYEPYLSRDAADSVPIPLEESSLQPPARLKAGPARFTLTDVGVLTFSATSYDRMELAGRFQAAYAWESLKLPSLVDRIWLIVKREVPE